MGTPQERTYRTWLVVAVSGLLSFVAMLDMNIVNVALADISADFDIAPSTAQWAQLGYQLPLIALLLPAGKLVDRMDARTTLMTAVGGFALFSAAAAAAPSIGWLIAARLCQGAFGAVLFVMMPVLVTRAVGPEKRARAMSVPATLGPLGAMTGPTIGGVLLDQFGWPSVFLVKVPFCLAALLLAARVLPKPPASVATSPGSRRGVLTDQHPWREGMLIGCALAVLLLGLTFSRSSPQWLALAALAVPPVFLWLRSSGGRSIVRLLRDAGTGGLVGSVFTLAAGFAAMHFVLALHLQRDTGLSATATGLTLFAFPCAMGAAGPVGGRLAERFGSRRVALTGAALVVAGLALISAIPADAQPSDIVWRLALAGAGMGLTGGPTQALVMSAAPRDRLGAAGSVNQLARTLGFSLGPALATAVGGLTESSTDGARYGLILAVLLAGCALPLLSPRRRRDPGVPDTTTPPKERSGA